jgi:hypothetical protein
MYDCLYSTSKCYDRYLMRNLPNNDLVYDIVLNDDNRCGEKINVEQSCDILLTGTDRCIL